MIRITPKFTTVETAHYLNVSQSFVMKEIETGQLKCQMAGTHRQVAYEDLVEYQCKMQGRQQDALQRLTDNTQELRLGN